MKRLAAVCLLLLPGCWAEKIEVRSYKLDPDESVEIKLVTDEPLWVTFEVPEELDFDRMSRTCPVLEDGVSTEPMCAEISQDGDDGLPIALVRGVIGAGMRFKPIDGALDLKFTNFSAKRITFEIRIEPGN